MALNIYDFSSLYWKQNGHAKKGRLAIFSHLHVSETSQQTTEDFYPYFSAYLEPLFKIPIPKEQYDFMLSPQGSLVGGSPQQVIDKILYLKEHAGASRYVGQIDIGEQAFADVVKGVELFASKYTPVVSKS